MADQRSHRGRHPEDSELFDERQYHLLHEAATHLSWLLTRGYAVKSSMKLVGDRFELKSRQRQAVQRSSVAEKDCFNRSKKMKQASQVAGETVWIDGFNLLTTIEAALSGGILLLGRDGCLRDMASMHGSYRKVEETKPALELLGLQFSTWGLSSVVWLLDQPVSNSGRLKKVIENVARENAWDWTVQLDPDPDQTLVNRPETVVSADSFILDGCAQWLNVAATVVASIDHSAIVVDFRPQATTE